MKNNIEIKDLSKKYKDFELKNIIFNVPEGCIVGFVGENGAGKTTTIKSILNMTNATMFLLIKANININLEAIEQFFNTYGIGILLISIVIMHYISYKISFKIYSNTEE